MARTDPCSPGHLCGPKMDRLKREGLGIRGYCIWTCWTNLPGAWPACQRLALPGSGAPCWPWGA